MRPSHPVRQRCPVTRAGAGSASRMSDSRTWNSPRSSGTQRVPFFTRDEAMRIIEAAKEPYKTLFAVAWGTGMRAGEILALTRSDLDFERKTIRVNKSSDDKTREIRQPKTRNSVALLPLPSALHWRHGCATIWNTLGNRTRRACFFRIVHAPDRGNGNQSCSTR